MLGLIRGAYGQSDDVPNVKNHDTMILCFSINECYSETDKYWCIWVYLGGCQKTQLFSSTTLLSVLLYFALVLNLFLSLGFKN